MHGLTLWIGPRDVYIGIGLHNDVEWVEKGNDNSMSKC